MKDTTTTEGELLIPEVSIVAAAFEDDKKIAAIIEAIEKECRSEHYSTETAVGRKRISSQAYKISRSKTAMDKVGADRIEEATKLVKTINSRRNTVKTRLDALRDEIRKPLTDWEEKDDLRKQGIKDRIIQLFGLRDLPENSGDLRKIQDATIAVELDDTWQEFLEEATKAKDNFLRLIGGKIQDAVRIEEREAQLERERQEQAAELARLREAEAQRQREADAAAEAQKKADEERAAQNAEIAALKAQLEAATQQPLPEPVGIPEEAPKPELSGSTPSVVVIDEIAAQPPIHNPLGLGQRPRKINHEAEITSAILAVIEECETQEAAAAEIASAIIANQIPHVEARF